MPGFGESMLNPSYSSDTMFTSPRSPIGVNSADASSGLYPAPLRALFKFLANDLGALIVPTSSGKPSCSFALPFSEQLGISCAVKNTLAPVPPATSCGLYLPKLYFLGSVSMTFVFLIKLPRLNCPLAHRLAFVLNESMSVPLRSTQINVVGSYAPGEPSYNWKFVPSK